MPETRFLERPKLDQIQYHCESLGSGRVLLRWARPILGFASANWSNIRVQFDSDPYRTHSHVPGGIMNHVQEWIEMLEQTMKIKTLHAIDSRQWKPSIVSKT